MTQQDDRTSNDADEGKGPWWGARKYAIAEKAICYMAELKQATKTFAILFAGVAAGTTVACWWMARQPRSPLTAGLPADFVNASTEFDARIRAQFPLGMPIWKFTKRLEMEGFRPTWFVVNGESNAFRSSGNFVCNIAARVYWRAAQDGTLEAIRGVYQEEGCL